MTPSEGQGIIESLLQLLPSSPFAPYVDQFRSLPGLGYLNWFVPVRTILTIMAAWLTAVGLYYLYMVIMRWVKLIGD